LPKGSVFLAFFDEAVQINKLTLRTRSTRSRAKPTQEVRVR